MMDILLLKEIEKCLEDKQIAYKDFEEWINDEGWEEFLSDYCLKHEQKRPCSVCEE